MNCLFWNIRGLMGGEKQLELSQFLRAHKASFISLQETKLTAAGHSGLKRKLIHYDSSFLSSAGRICLFWNSELFEVKILHHSSQYVHCHILCKISQRSFFITSVYASNNYLERLCLWCSLLEISKSISLLPWLVGGDFNEVRYSHEKVGGRPAHVRRLRKFNECISKSLLIDLKATGHTYSWSNHQADHIMSRLDRILVNSAFVNDFPLSMVNYLASGISDHSPMHVICEPVIPSGPKPFKYFEMWEAHPSFKSTVESAWATEVVGNPIYCLVKKIAATKFALKQWNKATFGPIQHLLRRSRENLAEIQARLQLHPMDQNLITEEQLARAQYKWDLQQEESFLRQKSRQLWLSCGDSNTRFFYDSLNSRTTVNTIRCLQLPDGEEMTDPVSIKEHIVEYFSNLLNRDSGCTVPPLRSYGTISDLENQSLLAPISPEEIRKATFSLKPLSSPGPDGFPARFFQFFWALWKLSSTSLIQGIFSSRSATPSSLSFPSH
ncbi:hypothetical protein QJS10_CPB17g00695 [Acorus calamus]|uniref:Endonuclease/exonuclease/phosphatase domain-containing protein n=1 Tax=Acorus calamus TaxID=4465 RepID=A0AAV9CUW5_ACOCL|nr:hypothetical protein QJS10_CPB17g00695 [Acorus calamus]